MNDFTTLLSNLAIGQFVSDPRDQEAALLLRDIVSYQSPGGFGNAPAGEPFHLYELTPYLKVYRFVQVNPLTPWVVGGVAVAGLLWLGGFIGRN